MTDSAHPNDIQIDRVHSAAIRGEIGDRLRTALNAERPPLLPHLLSLLERFAAQERGNPDSKLH
jgi:hypothetical protein